MGSSATACEGAAVAGRPPYHSGKRHSCRFTVAQERDPPGAGAGRSGKSAASPMCGALVCAGEFARAFLWGVGGAFYRRQDGGSPYGRSRWGLNVSCLTGRSQVSCLRSARFPPRQRRTSARMAIPPIQSKNLIAFRGLDLVEYPPRAKKRDD